VKNYLLELKNANHSTEQAKYLELFYDDTAYLVFNYCKRKGLSSEDSEDITQIVYTQIYNKRLKYNPDFSPLAWLFIITKSEAKDYLKKSAIYSNYLEEYALFANLSQNMVDSPIKDVELDRLNTNERLVLEQRYLNDQDFAEIAIALGLTQTNVRKLISRALNKLRN
jgi:RNA polymerase sigma-70 factor, ECF subfamily